MGKIELQKKDRQAIVLYSQYSQEIVEAAIVERMAKMGNKGKESRSLINLNKSNFYTFKGARIPGTQTDSDLYFKTERRGRKDKDERTENRYPKRGKTTYQSLSEGLQHGLTLSPTPASAQP